MPDYWEILYGLNPDSAADGVLDFDQDGLTNAQEFLCGTDPLNPRSRLGFAGCRWESDGFVLVFEAVAGRTYSVEYRDGQPLGSWNKLMTVGPFGSAQQREIKDFAAADSHARYYRLATPASP
jgi:hypothetical protein